MKHALLLCVLAVAVSACGGTSPKSEPADVASGIETETANLQAQAASLQATTDALNATNEAKLPTDPPPRPTSTKASVPSDPDEFAGYIIANYGEVAGVDMEPTGKYLWLDGYPNHLIVYVSKGLFGNPLGDVDEKTKEKWLAPLIRDMTAFAAGEEWTVSLAFHRVETNAARAGENKVTWKDWMYVDDEYDSDAGGFRTTEYPVRVSGDSGGRIRSQVFVNRFDRLVGFYDQYLK